MALKINKG